MGSSSSPGGARSALPARRRARRAGRRLLPYLLILPFFAFVGLFVFWPVGYSVYLSTMEWKLGYASREFVLLDNYAKLLSSAEFRDAAINTVVYTVLMVVFSIGFGLLLSLAITRRERASSLWQAVFFLPVAATMAAMAVVWRYIFDMNLGTLNMWLRTLGLPRVDWLNQAGTAMGAVVFVSIWSNAGYAMVYFVAGLSAIPRELHEAAEIDGAGPVRRFAGITWPLLSPTTLFVLIIMTVRALGSFDTIKVLTNGGPLGATRVLSLLLYQEAFQFFDTGYASGIAVVLFVIVLALAMLQMRVEKWVHYQ
jgi:ABC-type sugar transport system permease subunit